MYPTLGEAELCIACHVFTWLCIATFIPQRTFETYNYNYNYAFKRGQKLCAIATAATWNLF